MAIRDIFKVSRKTFFNPSAWIDWNALQYYTRTIYDVLRALFTPASPMREETFEQAMARLGLNESDIANTIKTYHYYSILFIVLALLAFFYGFYLLFRYTAIIDFFLSLAVTSLFAIQAFRYDFWALQLKQRKLGLTFKDWKAYILGSKETKE